MIWLPWGLVIQWSDISDKCINGKTIENYFNMMILRGILKLQGNHTSMQNVYLIFNSSDHDIRGINVWARENIFLSFDFKWNMFYSTNVLWWINLILCSWCNSILLVLKRLLLLIQINNDCHTNKEHTPDETVCFIVLISFLFLCKYSYLKNEVVLYNWLGAHSLLFKHILEAKDNNSNKINNIYHIDFKGLCRGKFFFISNRQPNRSPFWYINWETDCNLLRYIKITHQTDSGTEILSFKQYHFIHPEYTKRPA